MDDAVDDLVVPAHGGRGLGGTRHVRMALGDAPWHHTCKGQGGGALDTSAASPCLVAVNSLCREALRTALGRYCFLTENNMNPLRFLEACFPVASRWRALSRWLQGRSCITQF
eukprot:359332-Chlamydomonas_euryale.AAC.7